MNSDKTRCRYLGLVRRLLQRVGVSVSRDLQVAVTSRRRSCHGDHVLVVCNGDHDDDDDDDAVQLGSSSRPATAT